MVVSYVVVYFHPLSENSLKEFDLILKDFNTQHPLLTPLLFIIFYIFYAVFMLPGIFILSLFSGFLFHQPFSTLYVIFSSTIGAALLFLIATPAFNEINTLERYRFLSKFEKGFKKNAANYLLFLRLIPLFPYKVVNLTGAFFKVPLLVFIWTTAIGMIPSVYIYTQAGSSLSYFLEDSTPFDHLSLYNLGLIISLIALSVIPLIPIFFKKK